jgi:hypothetical protein
VRNAAQLHDYALFDCDYEQGDIDFVGVQHALFEVYFVGSPATGCQLLASWGVISPT